MSTVNEALSALKGHAAEAGGPMEAFTAEQRALAADDDEADEQGDGDADDEADDAVAERAVGTACARTPISIILPAVWGSSRSLIGANMVPRYRAKPSGY